LFVFLTIVCVLLGYIRFVGIGALAWAIGPPLLIAGAVNGAMLSFLPPPMVEADTLSAPVRVLMSLVIGYLVWMPILLSWVLL
jgi:hypothetical protein